MQSEHPQWMKNSYAFLDSHWQVDLILTLFQDQIEFFDLLNAALPRNDGSDRHLNGRLRHLEVVQLLHYYRHVLNGG